MAYVPGFEHDVFVSYAHVDNHPRLGDKKGWVGQFGDDLVAAIDQELGRSGLVKFWRDRRLAGNDVFDDVIRGAVRQSALFVPILSPGYMASDYCAGELREFATQQHRLFKPMIGDKMRVFKILHSHLALEDHPVQTQGCLGFNFSRREEETGEELRLYAISAGYPNESYHQELRKVALRLVELLKQMARMATIYVAETDDPALLSDRVRLLRFLRQSGFRVLPEDRPEMALLDPESNIQADLKRSALSVHIIGQRYGKALLDGRSKLHTAFDLAALRTNSLTAPLVWRHDEPGSVIDPPQQSLIDSLYDEGPGRFAGEQLPGFEELKEQILSKTFPYLVTPRSSALRAAPNPLIYVSYLPVDRPQFEQIEQYLAAERCDLVSSPAESLSEHELLNLRFCSGMVIVYGEAPPNWVKTMAVRARELIVQGTAERMRRFSIVDGPPEAKEDLGLSFNSLLVVNSRRGLKPDLLKEFVASIRS